MTILRLAGLAAAILGIGWLLLIEVVFRRRLRSAAHHWSLLIGIVVLPAIATLSAVTITVDRTKTADFCASCHVMRPFIADMADSKSASLAALHHVNKWVPTNPCYECHTTYGLQGSLRAKVDGLRHWMNYVMGRWEGPMRYRGTYPNSNCLLCHGATPRYDRIGTHRDLSADLAADRIPCVKCHGPAHLPGIPSGARS